MLTILLTFYMNLQRVILGCFLFRLYLHETIEILIKRESGVSMIDAFFLEGSVRKDPCRF